MEFQIEYNGSVYEFELDIHGQVWQLEADPVIGVIKNGLNHEFTNDIEEARAIAVEMLYQKGL